MVGEGFHDPGVIGVPLHGVRPPVAGGMIVQDALDGPFFILMSPRVMMSLMVWTLRIIEDSLRIIWSPMEKPTTRATFIKYRSLLH